jgi:WD40 repeat protein
MKSLNRLSILAAVALFAVSHALSAQGLKKASINAMHASLMNYSPDGNYFIIARANRLVLYNAGTDTKITEFPGPNHDLNINDFAFNSMGSLLATAGEDNQVKIWSIPDGKILFVHSKFTNPVKALGWAMGDQSLICMLKDGEIRAINFKTGVTLYSKRDLKKPVALSTSRNGKFWAVGGADDFVTIYESATGNLVKKLDGLNGWTRALAFSQDGQWLARGGNGKKITLWDLNDFTFKEFPHTGWVNDLEFSCDSKQIGAALDNHAIAFFNVSSGHPSLKLNDIPLAPLKLSISPNGQEAAHLEDYSGDISFWNISSLNIAPVINFKDNKDTSPPQLLVSNPPNITDNRVTIYKDLIDLRGIVTDESGVRALKINGIETPIRQNGNFLINVPLSLGENFLTIEVTDVNDNITLKKITILRKNMDGENYVAEKATNYLFVVGVNDYRQWPKLNNAVKDANDVVGVLLKKYDFDFEHVTFIKNELATRANIYNGLRSLIEKITPNDNLMVYFSGHGHFDKLLNEGYWIPIDAATNSPADYISNTDILKILGSINSQHTFLVADACFSGALFADSRRGYTESVEKFRSRWGLASGRLETVSDGSAGNNSPFAKRFIQFLNENQKEKFPVSELVQFVKVQVAEDTNQTPIGNPLKSLGDEGGEFVFYKKRD